MGRPVARKKQHKGDKPLKEKYRMRRKTKDIDQIHEDLKRENAEKLLNQEVDLDKPGSAQFYCLHCAYVVTLSAPLLIKKGVAWLAYYGPCQLWGAQRIHLTSPLCYVL